MINTKENFQLYIRRIFLIIMDSCLISLASFLALALRFDLQISTIDPIFLSNMLETLPIQIIATLIIFGVFRIYSSLWQYASAQELLNIVTAGMVSMMVQLLTMVMLQKGMPRSYYLIYYFLLVVFVGGTRILYRFVRMKKADLKKMFRKRTGKKVMIVGAGEAGTALIREIQMSERLNYQICCAVDDDAQKHGKYIRGVQVLGGRNDIVRLAEKFKVDKILIAMPRVSAKEVKPIIEICQQTECEIQKVAGIYQMINGEVNVSQLKKVEIEDLLGREPVHMDLNKILEYVQDRVVVVTGGSGSIGSEICRQIATKGPKKLLIIDIYENTSYTLQQELTRKYPELDFEVLIASVRDENRIRDIFRKYRPEIIFHAAAHKHVPLMEVSPNEAIKNNVLGTYNVVKLADEFGVKRFIQISTDKAVNPTNIMGASKRICEMIIQSYNKRSKTEYVAVRFGNVLGSNGSVIPLFRKQIEEGGPLTVTHPEIIRYFMTIPEAVSLVLMAGAYAKGGEIFVLDMGEPVKILDLAKNMIRLAGLKEGEDIDIVFSGLRPGEKLYEELLMDEEGMKPTENSLIFIGHPIEFDEDNLYRQLDRMREESGKETADMRAMVKEIVPTYVLPEEMKK